MFFLLPVPERSKGIPLLTSGIIFLTALIFAIAWPTEKHQASMVSRDDWQAHAKALTDIALLPEGVSEPLRSTLEAEKNTTPPSSKLLGTLLAIQSNPISLGGGPRFKWDSLYPRFEAMTRSIAASREGDSLYRRFGFNPQSSYLPGLVTHIFLHAGFLHIFFNLLFLWVIGTVIEPRLGFSFLPLYLVGGMVAAICQAVFKPIGADVMVGASGAVAAMMGFGLTALPSAKIRLFYAAILGLTGRAGTFESPLWFCLPLWALQQLFMAGMTAGLEVVQVGYVAHLGGFVFGALVGLAARSMGMVLPLEPERKAW